ncbi:tripartite tricarboxylate transporter permease [Yaniella flava]|uniref:Tripartite tricarboxylate transporter permease n=2 Tax=Yaniella flava TaxID=287930 RepID=A0ABN2UC66_9MICC
MTGLESFLDPTILILTPIGVLLGALIGAVPGLSATVGIAIFLPFTFALDPLAGLVLLLGIYNGACYAGSIPAILLRTPGTPASAATVIDGYSMTKKGQAGRALSISLVASVIGGLISTLLMIFLAPVVADFALGFGPAEYFALAVLALAIIASLGEGSIAKGIISGAIGIMIAMVGLDGISGFNRFTFGVGDLSAGIELVPLLVGLFGAAEAIRQIEARLTGTNRVAKLGTFKVGRARWRSLSPHMASGGLIGFIIGILPGVGGDIGGYMAYNESRRFARTHRSRFGKGDPRGVAAAESANNSAQVGGLIPTLTLGIPGNAAAAVLMGALLIQGLQPGPQLFTGSPDLVYGTFIALVAGFIFLLVIGMFSIRLWAQVIRIPPALLWPMVLVLTVIGAYAVRTNPFDVLVMLIAGVIGYLMMKTGWPVAPLLIGVIVGPLAEQSYRRAMIQSGGSLEWALEPIPLVLLILAVLSVVYSVWQAKRDVAKSVEPKVAPQSHNPANPEDEVSTEATAQQNTEHGTNSSPG